MFYHSLCHFEQVTNFLHLCNALEFEDEILQEKWFILCVVLAVAIHSQRLCSLLAQRPSLTHRGDWPSPDRTDLCLPPKAQAGFSSLLKRSCARLIREGTIPRLVRCLKTFTKLSRQVLPFLLTIQSPVTQLSHWQRCLIVSQHRSPAHCCHRRVSYEEGATEDTTWFECQTGRCSTPNWTVVWNKVTVAE